MLKKIGGLIKRHKILFSLCLIVLIGIIFMIVVFLKITVNTSGLYGNRLDGIDKVEISEDAFMEISAELEEKEEVSNAKLRLQGKIIYVDISFTDSTTLAKGKEIAATVLENFSDEELKFYNFSFIINQVSDKEDADCWASAGSKNSNFDKISWTRG